MSRRTSRETHDPNKKATWKGFTQITLPEGTELSGLWDLFEETDINGILDRLLESGYKVSFSKDWDSGACVVSVTGDKQFCENAGYTTSTFASSIESGIVGCAWKVYYFNGGQGWNGSMPRSKYEL